MRDNQPKHRQMRREQRRIDRRRASRKGLPSLLIVCEGRETEANYIAGLCEHLNVNLAAVRILRGDTGTDPASLVRRAQRVFDVDRDLDRVFVVCDDDGRDFLRATQLARKRLKKLDGKFLTVELIVSRPCFEFWLLLHFEYSTRSFASAAEVTTCLGAHLTAYQKSDRDVFRQVAAGLSRACERAEQLRRERAKTRMIGPYSDVDALVKFLSKEMRS